MLLPLSKPIFILMHCSCPNGYKIFMFMCDKESLEYQPALALYRGSRWAWVWGYSHPPHKNPGSAPYDCARSDCDLSDSLKDGIHITMYVSFPE